MIDLICNKVKIGECKRILWLSLSNVKLKEASEITIIANLVVVILAHLKWFLYKEHFLFADR